MLILMYCLARTSFKSPQVDDWNGKKRETVAPKKAEDILRSNKEKHKIIG